MRELVHKLVSFWDAQEPTSEREAIDYWHERMAWLGVHFPGEEASQLVDMRLQRAVDRWSERHTEAEPGTAIGSSIEAGTRRALKEAASAPLPPSDTNSLCAERVIGQVCDDLGVPRAEAARMVIEVCGPPATLETDSPIGIIRKIAEQSPS